ncbi:MAG: AMP-binding protein [Gammaproteobacteria bacterium]|nr:AMP-binding protein [Gammaproteobacteria bacterium]
MTYAEFWYRARKMASYLANKNIKANKLVGIYLDKSINQWIILVAIWIIGSYYLPLDKRWSLPKLKKLLDDAQCDVIITEAEQEIYTYSSHINIDAIDFLEMPLAEITHHEAAYMIATSGSTGNPKLSIITHAAFTNMAMAIKDILQTPSQCRILQYSPLCLTHLL